MVSPNQKTKHGNRQAGKRDEAVAEDVLAREVGDQLADHAHRRQDHDVDRRMGIKPEQVLKQYRIAAECRIENADARDAFKGQKQDRDRDHRSAENHDQAGRVH